MGLLNRRALRPNHLVLSEEEREELVLTIGRGWGRRNKLSEKDVIMALEMNMGNVSSTAKMLKCHYSNLMRFINDSEACTEALSLIKSIDLDLAENKLRDKIKDGNLTAIIFFLKCKGRDRGWIESVDVTLPTVPILFSYEEALIKREEPKKLENCTAVTVTDADTVTIQ